MSVKETFSVRIGVVLKSVIKKWELLLHSYCCLKSPVI